MLPREPCPALAATLTGPQHHPRHCHDVRSGPELGHLPQKKRFEKRSHLSTVLFE